MARREELTDEQWVILEPLIPAAIRRADGHGRPQLHSDRAVPNGVLWVLRTGAAWADLPERFPSGCTCCKRFTRWVIPIPIHNVPDETDGFFRLARA
jgi:transposase